MSHRASTGGAHAVAEVGAIRFQGGAGQSVEDVLAVERPLTIQLAGETLTLTMRTPGHDTELTAGFLVAEGWVEHVGQIESLVQLPTSADPDAEDIVEAVIAGSPRIDARPDVRRGTLMSSACGVCGRATIDDLLSRCTPVEDTSTWDIGVVQGLTTLLADHQPLFSLTGGLHAAALVRRDDLSTIAFEDVGRHNAVDKVVGRAFLDGRLPLDGHALVVSGRTSFEIVQKAAAAGVPLVIGVSAPSSLAVDVAQRARLTLVGFARGDQLTVYSGSSRLRS